MEVRTRQTDRLGTPEESITPAKRVKLLAADKDTLLVMDGKVARLVDPRSGRLYVGTEGEGVFTSDDAGTTLERSSTGLAEGRVAALVPDPGDPSRVYFFRAYGGEEGTWRRPGAC